MTHITTQPLRANKRDLDVSKPFQPVIWTPHHDSAYASDLDAIAVQRGSQRSTPEAVAA